MGCDLKPNELTLIAGFLDDYGSRLENDGCNDFELDDTLENQVLVRAAMKWNDPASPRLLDLRDGKILTHNSMLVGYLRNLVLGSFPD